MTLWESLPPEIRAALVRLAGGQVIRIPKHPEAALGEHIRAEYDAYTRVYGMSEGEAIHAIAKNRRLTHSAVRRFL